MPGYDALEPGYTGNENDDPSSNHRPYVRHVHMGWRRDDYGQWVSDTWDESRWEVVCPQCGDEEGPSLNQSQAVQKLRGPYATKHKAEHAAHEHERHANPKTRWTPGSTVPQPGPI
jgi:hypothetical protein